jgi:hypothetical protein|tara:strand:+ start:249 stop:1130 length:882 start_codon:yes stop_codon:yes gene_type:complete
MTEYDKIFKEKMDTLLGAENTMDAATMKIQKLLLSIFEKDYLPKFEIENGTLTASRKNLALLSQIDSLFDKIRKAISRDVLADFVKTILRSSTLNAEYYIALGFEKKRIYSILREKVNIERLIGITPTGKAKKGGYIARLTQTRSAREQIIQYVTKSLTTQTPFLDFQSGVKDLIVGTTKKGAATKGVLQKYFDQYAYDAFNQYDEVSNKQFAEDLGLKHFIYEGSEILTSRAFCKKRIGKAFTVKETKKWKDDPTLIEKKTKSTYNPLIERGRYKCRHFVKYITKLLYDKIK